MQELFRNKYRIKSTRLPNWDYSSNGFYFVTICTKNRECFFGNISAGKIQLSEIGNIVQKYWWKIPKHFKNILLDEFVIMPNHLHGIVVIESHRCHHRRDVACNVSTDTITKTDFMSHISPKPGSLSTIIRSFKSKISQWCNKNGFHNFAWQPRFHDHIIRNEKSLNSIRNYIKNNPMKWDLDKNNSENLYM